MRSKTKEEQQWKFQLMLPVLILPFITLVFWALGGGPGNTVSAQAPGAKGLKTDLPGANIKGDPANKMSYYELANADSLANNELRKNDPYYRGGVTLGTPDHLNPYGSGAQQGLITSTNSGTGYNGNEAAIYQRINDINNSINQPVSTNRSQFNEPHNPYGSTGNSKADLDRLEAMMKAMSSAENKPDGETVALNTMLERIIDIQNPALAQEKLRAASKQKKGQVFPVTAENPVNSLSFIKADTKKSIKNADQGFYSLNGTNEVEEFPLNTIKAIVHGTQTVVSGAELEMRLLNDAFINGVKIPKGQLITGTASLNGERLMVHIQQIQYNDHLFPVNLSVYDLTGLEGIRIEGAMSRDVATQSGTNAIQGLNMPIMDPSIVTQAASVGIEFTKGLIGKKAKRVLVTVKAGHKILLKDENQDSGE